MTWAARYSATDKPELTIYDETGEVSERWNVELAEVALNPRILMPPELKADIAARVPVRECEETQACTRHAMPDGRCREHGGRDEL